MSIFLFEDVKGTVKKKQITVPVDAQEGQSLL